MCFILTRLMFGMALRIMVLSNSGAGSRPVSR
jgi:hypothetical protein